VSVVLPAVTIEGDLLPAAVVRRITEGDTDVPSSDAVSYGLESGESVRRYANRSFAYLRDEFREFGRHRAGASAKVTRDRWLRILLRELGFDGLEALPGGMTVEDKPFPVNHRWGPVPVHLLAWGTDLDRKTPGMRGAAAAAPHAMIQQLLNRSDECLWALLSNGQKLRLLRDSTSLVGSAYVEFDLEAIFDGELFADFVVMYRIAHASRLAVRNEETGPNSCVLESWRAYGAAQGERALNQLRVGMREALELLGTGFLDHPDNPHLRASIDRDLSTADFKRALLRLAYRLLFWFVAEDRDVLLDPDANPDARQRYSRYFSARRLRELALRRRHSSHGDLWEAVRLVFDILGSEQGRPRLGLPGIGGIFEDGPLDEPLAGAHLPNTALLEAVEALAVLAGRGGRRHRVDFRHLGAEELGGVYESLLELIPRWDGPARRFHLEEIAGNDRKKTGSYYTPSSLVESLLDSALEPLLDEAVSQPDPVTALLNVTVCDPACGSGHFLIGAARRIAKRVAAERTGELEPSVPAVQAAMREVVAHCIYGVDVNEMAAELAKVSLWLETMEPGRPLSYLDTNIRVGDSLLGVAPRLLREGIPEAAFKPLEGDDKKTVTALRKQNAVERSGQADLFSVSGIDVGNLQLAKRAQELVSIGPPKRLADVHVQAARARELEQSADRQHRKLIADAWCAAFVQTKQPDTRNRAVTQAVLERLSSDEPALDLAPVIDEVEQLARQYRFFHWHLEFPHIFKAGDYNGDNQETGWTGGFTCVLGNPPWERVKLQEQEFFAARDIEVAQAPNAAARKKLIKELATSDEPGKKALHKEFRTAVRQAEGISHLLRSSDRHPLTGRGDINTYAVFAETGRTVLHPRGQFGMILPTGIATDATTQAFFRDLVVHGSLVSLYDFENEDKVFAGVHNQFRFALLTLTGLAKQGERASLVFRVRQASQISARAFTLTPEEITSLNPNTGTCPVFDSRRDAEITLDIYRRVPVFWREGDQDGNPWGTSFLRMLDMANDSGSFHMERELLADGWDLDGNVFGRDGQRLLPLYEAKMIHHFDHRFSTYDGATQEQLNKGTLPHLSPAAHDDARVMPKPRYWVDEANVNRRLGGRWSHDWLLGWRDICRSVDERTLISAAIPRAAVGDKFLLALPAVAPACLQANLAAIVLDYVVRQKYSGASLKYFVIKQLPVLPQGQYDELVPWQPGDVALSIWFSQRVLELTYTAFDMAGYARDLGDERSPFRWIPERRDMIRAELDAAYFHLYGVGRDDVDYILDTFKVLRQNDVKRHGEYRTKRLILERYDAMAEAMRTGEGYRTPLDPPPGDGPRHPAKEG
jgi:hypothetical protein